MDSKGDKFDRFGDKVAKSVQELSSAYDQDKVMRKIREILFEAKYPNLNHKSSRFILHHKSIFLQTCSHHGIASSRLAV